MSTRFRVKPQSSLPIPLMLTRKRAHRACAFAREVKHSLCDRYLACCVSPLVVVGDSTTLIPLLDLLNHHDLGSFSEYARRPNTPDSDVPQSCSIQAYYKLSSFDYQPVRESDVHQRSSFPVTCPAGPGSQGGEVWAKYFSLERSVTLVKGAASVTVSQRSSLSCNYIMLNTCVIIPAVPWLAIFASPYLRLYTGGALCSLVKAMIVYSLLSWSTWTLLATCLRPSDASVML